MADDKLLTKILAQLATRPEAVKMQEYLTRSGAAPTISMDDLSELGSDVSAIYRQISPTGKFEKSVALDRFTSARNPTLAAGTLGHELTHATDVQLDTQARNTKGSQFADAYNKLALDLAAPYKDISKQRETLAAKLSPGFVASDKAYRASNDELPGFGVGNSLGFGATQPAPPHVDATMATEFMILLDLAMRNLKGNTK